jgi:hypothetical protein
MEQLVLAGDSIIVAQDGSIKIATNERIKPVGFNKQPLSKRYTSYFKIFPSLQLKLLSLSIFYLIIPATTKLSIEKREEGRENGSRKMPLEK